MDFEENTGLWLTRLLTKNPSSREGPVLAANGAGLVSLWPQGSDMLWVVSVCLLWLLPIFKIQFHQTKLWNHLSLGTAFTSLLLRENLIKCWNSICSGVWKWMWNFKVTNFVTFSSSNESSSKGFIKQSVWKSSFVRSYSEWWVLSCNDS